VCLSTSTTCSTFTAYSTSKTVALSGSGLKTVYAYFKDANGNISSAASDSINVDPTRPTDGSLSGTGVSGGVDLTWTAATDAGSGLASYTLVYKAGSSAPATCAAGSSVTRVTGIASSDVARSVTGLAPSTTYGFRLCAVDAVGNVSIGRTISKTTPSAFMGPDGPESANDGALATAPMEGEELLSDTDAMGMDDASGPGAGCSSIGEVSGRSGPQGLLAAFGALLGALGLRRRKA
jgi:hypothetical protein